MQLLPFISFFISLHFSFIVHSAVENVMKAKWNIDVLKAGADPRGGGGLGVL